jgi:hypothetical protein
MAMITFKRAKFQRIDPGFAQCDVRRPVNSSAAPPAGDTSVADYFLATHRCHRPLAAARGPPDDDGLCPAQQSFRGRRDQPSAVSRRGRLQPLC